MKNHRYLIVSIVIFLWIFSPACKKKDIETPAFVGPREMLATSSFAGAGLLLRMDYNGTIVKQKTLTAIPFNFQRWYVGGNIRYTYLESDTALGIQRVGYIPGSQIVLDSGLHEIGRYRLLPNLDHSVIDALDGHDFILLDDKHYIAMAYYEKVVSNIPDSLHPVPLCKVIAPIIQEVQNGKIIWEWDGTNYPEFYGSSVEGNLFSDGTRPHDYLHLNSMFVDPRDNNLICSFRNANQVVKLDRKSGNIIWRLGGKNSDFAITPAQQFIRQHHATLVDNNQTLLLYDNGDYVIRPSSRVLEFKLNEITKTVTEVKIFNSPYFGAFRGSVQKTDSSYFIGTGEMKYLEINYKTGQVIIDKDLPVISYRVLRY